MTIRRIMVKNNHRDPEQGSAMQEGKDKMRRFFKKSLAVYYYQVINSDIFQKPIGENLAALFPQFLIHSNLFQNRL